MIGNTKRKTLIVASVLLMVMMARAQTQRPKETLSIQGSPGRVTIVQLQGRELVDVQDLARITNSSLSFEGDRIILTMRCDASKAAGDDAGKSGFSRSFTKAAIEAMASIREWGGMLMITVQNGYPVGNTMAGNTIEAFKGRAADNVALASTAASTDADSRGLDLLKNEFNNVQSWSDGYIKARSSLGAANLTMTENGLQDNQEVQKMIHCGQFLAQMFAGGTFQEDAACR
jgi:hypothetical protein